MEGMPERSVVLVVDDEPINLRILTDILTERYEVRVATNGPDALSCMRRGRRPDIVLLDVDMPSMNGYEVCRQIRQDPRLRDIPVMFVTALADTCGEARGLKMGAVDFIAKPFNAALVAARVNVQLELKLHRDRLEQLAETRARQLIHAERLVQLGTLAAGVAHEINTPLTCISAYAQLLTSQMEEIESHLDDLPRDVSDFLCQCVKAMPTIFESGERIAAIVRSMRDYARKDSGEREECRMEECVDSVLRLLQSELRNRAEVRLDIPPNLPPFMAVRRQFEQVLVNLIKNAADALAGILGPFVCISAREQNGHLLIAVEDNGLGIPEDKLQSIWEPFFTTKGEAGTGLGLSISRGIVEDHKGTLTVENGSHGGARFLIEMPLAAGDA